MYLAVALFFITNLFSLYRLSESRTLRQSSSFTVRLVALCPWWKDVLRVRMDLDAAHWSGITSSRPIQSQTTVGVKRPDKYV